MRGFFAVFCGLLLLAGPAHADWGVDALMQGMAQVKSADADFTETRVVPMLQAPLSASGTLSYTAPDRIRKTTLSPQRQDFLLADGEITLTAGGQTHRFSLRQNPAIGGLTEGIRATLAGDLPALQQIYTIALSGSAAGWQLLLKPKDSDLLHFVAWVAIRGAGNRITEIDSADATGGRSDMQVSETQLVPR